MNPKYYRAQAVESIINSRLLGLQGEFKASLNNFKIQTQRGLRRWLPGGHLIGLSKAFSSTPHSKGTKKEGKNKQLGRAGVFIDSGFFENLLTTKCPKNFSIEYSLRLNLKQTNKTRQKDRVGFISCGFVKCYYNLQNFKTTIPNFTI